MIATRQRSILRTERAQRRFHEVVIANGDSAAHNQRVSLQPTPEQVRHPFQIVSAMLDQGDIGSGPKRERVQHDGVALKNLPRTWCFPDAQKLVARRDNRDLRQTAYLDLCHPLRGEERESLRRHRLAARKNLLSFHKVGSFSPDELAWLHAGLQHDRFAFFGHVLLHDDRVSSRRQRRAGKNANCLSRSDRQAAIRAGRLFAADAQSGSELARSRLHRVAIHRRIVESRERSLRKDIPCRKSA